ncbi:MAG: hypothetical protein JWO38_6324 [Gemmataceae bacterium]|nr:hypothetical protein [Gemmataceae bacterium]
MSPAATAPEPTVPPLDPAAEELVARLTLAAYDVALRQGIKGEFTELQAALWRELGGVIRECGISAARCPTRLAV